MKSLIGGREEPEQQGALRLALLRVSTFEAS